MQEIVFICVGKLKESWLTDAFAEYTKRLKGYCSFKTIEIAENRLPASPSTAEIDASLEKEGRSILAAIPKGAYTIAMCVEGKQISSPELSKLLVKRSLSERPVTVFVIGGSFGLSGTVKKKSDLSLSMSEMTFPHHLARVMLAEQVYRAFKINEGSDYHK